MLYGIATATAALFLAALLSALLRVPALRLGLVDRRRVRPVPLLGGAAVVGSTCLVAAAGGWTGAAPLSDGVGRLLAAGAGVAVLGLVADVWRLKTWLLLVGSAIAAAFVVPYDETGVPAGIAAVVWIACAAAAFRGLDHVDGLAGTVGVLVAFGVGVCAAAEVMDDLAVLLSLLAAALTGFLMHNWHPARIAFGACGSLFTGFVLAASAVLVRTGYDAGSTAAVLFALTATATADAVLVVLSRRLAGRPVVRRGPDHLGHRLRRLGLTPPGTTVLLGTVTFGTVLVGVLVHTGWLAPVSALWTAGVLLPAVLGLLRVRVYGPRRHTGQYVTGTRTGIRSGTRTDARTGIRTGAGLRAPSTSSTGVYAGRTRAGAGGSGSGDGDGGLGGNSGNSGTGGNRPENGRGNGRANGIVVGRGSGQVRRSGRGRGKGTGAGAALSALRALGGGARGLRTPDSAGGPRASAASGARGPRSSVSSMPSASASSASSVDGLRSPAAGLRGPRTAAADLPAGVRSPRGYGDYGDYGDYGGFRDPVDVRPPGSRGRYGPPGTPRPSLGYPLPPPQQSASSQVREALRVRDG
ncbi:MraY family glycosyltransferase [Streptomyces sp. NPDC056160]|uniref:MraY family glycosyltransferase n=1 Tax=Streptomyces sp. NPDC056160 TaxID=3345731 RepID=UPI0035DEED12